jgi:S-adenosylmethionine:tRNA ribosyltransferase-isomerase
MRVDDFAYDLPEELIAQRPVEPRDAARMLVAPLDGGPLAHRTAADLDRLLRPGDLLVLNRTRVIPARLEARTESGGEREVLLVHPEADGGWRVLIRGRVRPGQRLLMPGAGLTVAGVHEDGARSVRFDDGVDVLALADRHGEMPLPPYIRRHADAADRERYQTVFGDRPGSVAAPTASLHLTEALLARLDAVGVRRAFVELRVGPGTFKPVDTERIEDFRIHAEWADCPAGTVAEISATKAAGGRVVAVGTTVVRTLESAARQPGGFGAWNGWTSLFLHPPERFQVVDGLMTNFHLPRSTLLMLVACLTGLPRLREVYATAVRERYRFFSYGDCCLFLPSPLV